MNDNTSSDNDIFFDEDGNLINTAWDLARQKEEEEKKKEEERLKELKKRKEINRKASIDEMQAQLMDKQEKSIQRRKAREEWMTYPRWIQSMPHTRMSAPPTEGRKEIMLTRVTGRVHLTDKERKSRENNLRRIKVSVDEYKKIHQRIHGISMLPVPIVSLDDSVGGSLVTRCLSQVFQESRADLGKVVSFDFGSPQSNFLEWFGKENARLAMRNIINYMDNLQIDLGYFPSIKGLEFFLPNDGTASRRSTITVNIVKQLYSLIRNEKGISLFDCSYSENIPMLASLALGTTPVFVLPMNKNAVEKMNNTLEDIRISIGEQKYQDILHNGILVVSSRVAEMSNDKGREVVDRFLSKIARETGMNEERTIHIPYDEAFSSRPLKWNKVSFPAKHALRRIAGIIIDDVADK